ncbi:DUF885 domain-containing protein [Candidatus Viadribacter manganicus]|uniref:DUF885 domain-containing protein n=1 Tax=Candidatus Viadribacter manganicus TaxID=1759059 RepID=A0A1B1AHD1_9PROT|nr:DUF885 family protein [Candidatus Viadribacter manganicus]ANP45976.1 hypothetical protein ATE48_08610 [Candidatus Viadribacter manganicus]
MIRTIAVCTAVFLTAATPALAQQRSNRALATVITAYEQTARRYDPITSASEGDRAALRLLPDTSREGELAFRAELVAFKARLERTPTRGLSEEDALNRSYLMRVIDQSIEGIDLDFGRAPIGNGDGFFTAGDYLAYTTPIQSGDDAEAWLARLEALPNYYQQGFANARRGIQTGYTQPRIVVERALDTARAQVGSLEATLLTPLASMPSNIPAAQQEQYRERARAIIRDRIMPLQRETVAFIENEYLPAARPQLGLRSVPGGADLYRYLVRSYTTTDMTPEQINELGNHEVARIRALMEQEIRASGFRGDFAAFQRFLRTDRQFYAQTPDELIRYASEIAKRADGQLPRLFGTLPRLSYGIRVIPAEQAEGSTTAYYTQGSAALGQSGTYWVNTTRLDQRPLYELPALTVHEAMPGHHLQISRAQELGELPYFRRNAFETAFVEGWGLYSESLGEDMGLYRTPYERFGRLSYEMWRACRLVADTGIHWLGWDIEQARRCFTDNTALSPHNIQTELERYIATPGQALAYKIGELTMQRLRREATQALGDRFDIRAFHDELLSAGAVPMDVLEARMHRWVQRQQAAEH